ncbi:MAG TPA: SdrD B-like domain-containing protein, partial [Lentzea sp.]
MTVAIALTFGSASGAAFAQNDPTSTPVTPTETSTPPSSSSETPPPPPAKTEPVQAAAPTGLSGVVYADKNGNGQQDPGEALGGQTLEIIADGVGEWLPTTTDADGNFAYTGLTPGIYHMRYHLDGQWIVHRAKPGDSDVTVKANQMTKVVIRGERPYSEQLEANVTLDRESYRLPATAKITLTLANRTDRKISNVKALCNDRLAPNALGQGS